jgi:hypothetical protein
MAEQTKAQLHEEMLLRITILENVMAELEHAWPPITKQDFHDIKEAIARLKAQPAGPIRLPDLVSVNAINSNLRKIASKLENNQPLPYWPSVLNIALTELAQSVSDRLGLQRRPIR